MSRNLSINQIAPHITSASVPGIDATNNVPAFSPYVRKSYEQQAEEQPKQKDSKSGQPDTSFPNRNHQKDEKPEIFKLIALPDFSDFFVLSNGKDGAKMMYIIKDIRAKRGVTKSLPISKNRIPAKQDTYTYLNTDAYFAASKGEQFTGKI